MLSEAGVTSQCSPELQTIWQAATLHTCLQAQTRRHTHSHTHTHTQSHVQTHTHASRALYAWGSHLAQRTPCQIKTDSNLESLNPWNTFDPNKIWIRWRLLPRHAKLVLADHLRHAENVNRFQTQGCVIPTGGQARLQSTGAGRNPSLLHRHTGTDCPACNPRGGPVEGIVYPHGALVCGVKWSTSHHNVMYQQ